MNRERLEKSLTIFTEAREKAKDGAKKEARKLYTCAFYLRCTDEETNNPSFSSFFAYQFCRYLSLKKRIIMSLPEGDMISDLIKSTYLDLSDEIENSMFQITEEGRYAILKNARITFPGQNDPKCSSF